MLPLGFDVGGPDSNSYCGGALGALWLQRGHGLTGIMLPLWFAVGGPDSNSYCRGALGALWLQREHGLNGIDAPTRV